MSQATEQQLHRALEALLHQNTRLRLACGRPYGLRSLEILALEALFSLDDQAEMTPSCISAWMKIQNPVLSPVLAELEKKGYLQSRRDDRDRRRRLLSLTQKGREVARDFYDRKQADCRDMTAFLGEADAAELARLLGRLAQYQEERRKNLHPEEGRESEC